jgi:UDP-N-acetylglucosamine 2-epimerase (non-hydrolysing)
VAVKIGVPVAHVEAGLRSFDRAMPEEINRVLTDSISELLFCTEQSGVENLRHEGVADEKIHLVGNVMIDTLMRHRERADREPVLEELGLEVGGYAVMTLHRPSNVDDPATLGRILDALEQIESDMPIVFPVHPRTLDRIDSFGLTNRMESLRGLRMIDPLGYLPFLKLMSCARIALTDSGGIQEETTILGTPCLTLRENTERPATIDAGTNQLVGTDPQRILAGYRSALERKGTSVKPPLWDGKAAGRIVEVIARSF